MHARVYFEMHFQRLGSCALGCGSCCGGCYAFGRIDGRTQAVRRYFKHLLGAWLGEQQDGRLYAALTQFCAFFHEGYCQP